MKKAAWFLPSLLEGSGGHRTIIQNACFLASKGEFQCDLYVEDDGAARNEEELNKLAEKYFGDHAGCKFILGYELKDTYDLFFATAWFTAKVVRDIPSDKPKLYFIQDFEACFNPMGDGYLMACSSYSYGLRPITIGKWLTHKMISEYAAPSQYFDFCADRSVYRPLPSVEKENAICFVYQPDKPRRCCAIGLEALCIVKTLRPDVSIYLYGSRWKGSIGFPHTNLEILPLEECNRLYNRCRVGLCISSSNPSRIPFEMMSAGLPVVDVCMENNLYDMPDSAISLAYYTPEAIAQAIIDLLDSPETQTAMSEAGQEYMKDKDLAVGFEQFYQAVQNVLADNIPQNVLPERLYNKQAVIARTVSAYDVDPTYRHSDSAGIIARLKNSAFLRRSKLLRSVWNRLRQIFI